MGEVIELNCETTQPLSPDKVLTGALGSLSYVLVVGRDKDGKFYAACSESDLHAAVFLAQQFIHKTFEEYLPHEGQ